MNAQSSAIGRAIQRLHALQTFTTAGRFRTVAEECESAAIAADVVRMAHEIATDLMVGTAETACDWAGEKLTPFEREALRCRDAIDEILADRADRIEAYASENGEISLGEYSTINISQLGLTSAVARV